MIQLTTSMQRLSGLFVCTNPRLCAKKGMMMMDNYPPGYVEQPSFDEVIQHLEKEHAIDRENLKVATEALEFYANMHNWIHIDGIGSGKHKMAAITNADRVPDIPNHTGGLLATGGKHAIEALEKINKVVALS
jgi:hypothetical protein